ncbi:MAG TPA: glycosyltransferase [Chloroflexia bacterium]|nr:glycosyltransferase [Chloroflexia bacterium]
MKNSLSRRGHRADSKSRRSVLHLLPTVPAPPLPSQRPLLPGNLTTKARRADRASSAPPDYPPGQLRIALYSHDAMGLGHMRRNLLIARTLAGPALKASILMIAGAGEATAFGLPPGVDCLTLPALRKESDGSYHARNLSIALPELIALRGSAIGATLEAFHPDVLIVDKMPRGIGQELDSALARLCAYGRTRCVLGLRDVLDDPETVHREWDRDGNEHAIRRYYDAIWIYGDPQVYDLVREYELSADIAKKARYTGYLDQRLRLAAHDGERVDLLKSLGLPPGRLMLCLVGGGQDGSRLAEAFSEAALPQDAVGVILTGPHMPVEVQQRLHRRASQNPRMRVLEFVPEPAYLMSRADRVVAMGGYNTTCEILSFGKPALLVPRVKPRLEQWIRAERLRDMGLLDVLHPDELHAAALTQWMARPTRSVCDARRYIDMDGLSHLPALLSELVAPPSSSPVTHSYGEGAWHVSN